MGLEVRPILFLDIDGVLNSESWYRRRPKGDWCEAREIDPEALFLLRAVVAMSRCEIVVSSSWRIGRLVDELRAVLPGMPIIDKTPVLTTGHSRGAEVDAWLKENPWCSKYAVVDDNSDFYEYHPRVQTEWKVGLTAREAETLVQMLS